MTKWSSSWTDAPRDKQYLDQWATPVKEKQLHLDVRLTRAIRVMRTSEGLFERLVSGVLMGLIAVAYGAVGAGEEDGVFCLVGGAGPRRGLMTGRGCFTCFAA
jgi:hypothetical protein